MTTYSISAASRITGKSRTTISKHLKHGKLSSAERGPTGVLIDAAELIRVYGADCEFEVEEGRDKVKRERTSTEQGVQVEVTSLRNQLDKEVAERERERMHYREQIAQLELALERAQEGHNRATLLLENQSNGGGQLRSQLEVLEARIEEINRNSKQPTSEKWTDHTWWELLFNGQAG